MSQRVSTPPFSPQFTLLSVVIFATAAWQFVSPSTLFAKEEFRFPEGRYEQGELRYISGLPVLMVSGTPEEIGRQVGVLALKPASGLVEHFRRYLEDGPLKILLPLLYSAAETLYRRFPEAYRQELEAMSKAAEGERNLLVLGNTIFDLSRVCGCTGILVSAERSATGGPLYGRNFDFPFDDLIAEYSLVVVYRPKGKKAFAMVTFPGLLASNCGMNEAGLTLGANTVRTSGDGSLRFNPQGTPYAPSAREVLENCGSVEECERLLRSRSHTAIGLLLACDLKIQHIYEVTARNIGVRTPEDGLLFCTNHFRLPPMAVETACRRYAILEKNLKQEKVSVADLARMLHLVSQGKWTIQTMVFEPEKLVLHLSLGHGPTAAKPLKALDLKPLLRQSDRP